MSQVRKGQDYALFFAVEDYEKNPDFPNLNNPIDDAEAIANELEEMYDFEAKVYKDPSKQKIYKVLKKWRNREFRADDQLFVFFSGHGDFDDFVNKGYFIPSGRGEQPIDLTDLGNIVTQIPCKHILLAMDACYSGTIDEKIAFKSGRGSRPGESSVTKKINLVDSWLRNKSRLLVTSGGKNQTPDGAEHSPFANAFLKGLRAAYASTGDGLFAYEDLLSLLMRVSPRPHKGFLVGHDDGDFVFVVEETKPKLAPDYGMVFIKGGDFQMGSNISRNEKPIHKVNVKDFYIVKYEVTQRLWYSIMGNNPSYFNGNNKPVENVSWHDVQKFIKKLNAKTGKNYRLPTEAEWEYAARGGNRSSQNKYAGTNEESSLSKYANFCDVNCEYDIWIDKKQNDGYKNTGPVGKYKPNELGLYDMSGNVWEWCQDKWYGGYKNTSKDGSTRGSTDSSDRVLRGGSWYGSAFICRVAYRGYGSVDFFGNGIGFRLAFSL